MSAVEPRWTQKRENFLLLFFLAMSIACDGKASDGRARCPVPVPAKMEQLFAG